jgi:hypothetical protein
MALMSASGHTHTTYEGCQGLAHAIDLAQLAAMRGRIHLRNMHQQEVGDAEAST